MQIFVELAPACKKSARAAHHLQHLDDFFEPCAPTVIANFSATMVTSLPSHYFRLTLSLSLSHRLYLTHNIGSASALPIIQRERERERERRK